MILKQILRNILRDSLNSIVVIVSLAIGIACFSLITLFINHELGTDNFHKDKDRIYALKCEDPWFPGKMIYFSKSGSVEYMKNNFARVEDFCRLTNVNPQKIVVNDQDYFEHPSVIGASENFFRFFSYKLILGDSATALQTTNSLAISSDVSKKYFGNENPLGKIITLFYSNKADQMIVTAVFEKPVENTQIVFDIVRMTGDKDSRSYIKLTKGSDPKDVEAQFLANKGSIPIANTGTPGSYFLEPLLSAYFDTTRGALSFEESRSKTDLWIALTIGLIVIGVAVFNYLGVLSNKCHKRTKEFYVRRINGSSISNLIFRQTLENVLLVVFSFIISMFFILDALPFLNTVTSGNVSNNFIFQPLQLIPLLIILVSLILITLVFTNFLIKSNISLFALRTNQTMKFKSTHIPVLNIFQLACSTGLLISTLIIFKQINYINNKSIGLDKDIIEIRIPGQNKDVALTFRNELLCSSSIDKVSVTGASPLLEHFLLGLKFSRGGIEKQYSVAGFTGDENYFKVLGIDILKGSGFSETISANKNKCLINETMAALFSDEDLIGKGIPGMEDMIVTGIVKDFNYSSLKTKIEPAFISYDNKGYHLLVKPKKGLANEAQKTINDLWHTLIPDFPVNTESVRARYEWYHRDNGNFIKLIGTCCIISIFLAMIGLFAVSYQNTRYRIKEIGIRKIHGARTIDIMKLVNSDFARWVIIAFVFSVPIAGYEMHKWLESYAYKVRISGWIFILAGMTTLIIAFITVSWQSWRAATRNPVEALRYE